MILLLGSPLFLRLWSSLTARSIAVSPEKIETLLYDQTVTEASTILYEDGLLGLLPELKRKALGDGTPPCWIPLPSPGKERHLFNE